MARHDKAYATSMECAGVGTVLMVRANGRPDIYSSVEGLKQSAIAHEFVVSRWLAVLAYLEYRNK